MPVDRADGTGRFAPGPPLIGRDVGRQGTMGNPKRHHYLPEFYLGRFCREGWLWLYDRPRNHFRHQKPPQVAVIGQYYTVRNEAGKKSLAVEELLQRLETEVSPLIDLVDRGSNPDEKGKMRLAEFAASLFTRVPQFEKDYDAVSEELVRRSAEIAFASPERAKSIVDSYIKDTGATEDIDPDDLYEFVKAGEYGIGFEREHSISAMLELIPDLAGYFVQMNWSFLHSPASTSFVTTDAPFVLQPPRSAARSAFGVGIATPGARKCLALSQKTCLVMGDRGQGVIHLELSREDVRQVNLMLTAHAHELVVGRDKELVQNLVETTGIDRTSPQPRFTVG